MNASAQPAQSVTHARVPEGMREAIDALHDDDFALGCECADPALQIDMWGREAVAQQLQRLS
jgi:hypothetical protein